MGGCGGNVVTIKRASRKPLRDQLLERVPVRFTEAERAELAQRIVVARHRWQAQEPLFPPEKNKRRTIVPTVERLKRALASAQRGLAAEVAQDLEQREALMIRREARGLSAVLDLHDVAATALAELAEWERRYRPKRNQSLAGSARLTEQLEGILRSEGRLKLSAEEFESVLDAINASGGPRLSIETLKRRRQRGTGTDKAKNTA